MSWSGAPFPTGREGDGTSTEAILDAVAAALVAGVNITITVDDLADTITIAATGGGSGSVADTLLLMGG